MPDRSLPERPIADRVFEAAPGVFRIPLPTPFPVGDVNVWWIDGPDPVLVDTGVRGGKSMTALEAALAAMGRRVEDVGTLLLTHGHVDHAGAAAAIHDRSGCPVRVSPRGRKRVADPAASHRDGIGPLLAFLKASGFSDATIEAFRAVSGSYLAATGPGPEPEPVSSGDVLRLAGGREVQVHAAPGHSADSLVYLLADAGVAFVGDAVLPVITGNPTLEASGPDGRAPRTLADYHATLERVAALPIAVACPGHGGSFGDVAGRCREIRTHQDARCDKVVDALRAAGPLDRKGLGKAIFGRVPPGELFLVLSEVQAAVAWLAEEGRVRLAPGDDGVDRYEAV
jgi:glyoxylase-like metal-dependent hydrolase (beta-lactamase superfamily II)